MRECAEQGIYSEPMLNKSQLRALRRIVRFLGEWLQVVVDHAATSDPCNLEFDDIK
jgi:uncharacterized protein YqiB (DUF1249 family)